MKCLLALCLSLIPWLVFAQTNSSSTGVAPVVVFNYTITGGVPFPYWITSSTPMNQRPTYCNLTTISNSNAFDNTTICVVVNGLFKMFFYPNVEDFSLLQIVTSQSYPRMWTDPNVWFQIEWSNGVSPPKLRNGCSSGTFTPPVACPLSSSALAVPFWTILISLSSGSMSDVYWDDACFSCASCVWGSCAIPQSQCGFTAGAADCDAKFYVGWTGTDGKGTPLVSAGKRFSQFTSYSISSAFSQAYATATPEVPTPSSFQWSGSANDCANPPC